MLLRRVPVVPCVSWFLTNLHSSHKQVGMEDLKAEVNLIRWPWSILARKNLQRGTPIICSAEIKDENGQLIQAEWRAEQLASRKYPANLARHIFLVLVTIAIERGEPITNRVRFTWYELCNRMGIDPLIGNIREMKRAIMDTKTMTIFSRNAIKEKSTGKLLSTTEKAWNIYSNVAFSERQLDRRVV